MRTSPVWHLSTLSWALWQMVALAAAAEPSLANVSGHQLERSAWIAGYRQLDAAGRQRALESLLADRTQRAAALVVSDAAFVELQRVHAQVLQRVGAGKSLSVAGLQVLWDQADALEDAAVQRLGRRYAAAVRGVLSDDPDAVEQRIEAWRRVYRDWQQAGAQAEGQTLLMDWLTLAIHRCDARGLAQLPARPNFAAPVGRSHPTRIAPRRPGGTPPALAASNVPRHRSPAPCAALPAAKRPAGNPAADPPMAVAVAVEHRVRNQLAGRQQRPALLLAAVGRPEHRAGSSYFHPAAVVQAVNRPPVVPVEAVARDRETVVATSIPRAASPAPRRTMAAAAGYIDLAELRDRLSGYAVAVAALNGHLHEDRLLDAGTLAELVETFEELVMRRGDLTLYCRLVADEGIQLPELDSPQPTISLLSAKISAARLHIERQPDEAQLPHQHAELAALDQLSRRMAVLAVELQEQK